VIAAVWVLLTVLTQPEVIMAIPARTAKIFNFISEQCNQKCRARQARFLFSGGAILKLSRRAGFS
jgi:hypothetical protein